MFIYPSISHNSNYSSFRLKRRFIFMGILNAAFAPFIVLYLLMYSFFRYFEVCSIYVLPRLFTHPT